LAQGIMVIPFPSEAIFAVLASLPLSLIAIECAKF
jgi:hypothetical protein